MCTQSLICGDKLLVTSRLHASNRREHLHDVITGNEQSKEANMQHSGMLLRWLRAHVRVHARNCFLQR